MCPVIGCIEGLNEGRMLRLYFLQRGGLFKFGIGQTELDLELCFNQVLPRLAFIDVTGLNLQSLQ